MEKEDIDQAVDYIFIGLLAVIFTLSFWVVIPLYMIGYTLKKVYNKKQDRR